MLLALQMVREVLDGDFRVAATVQHGDMYRVAVRSLGTEVAVRFPKLHKSACPALKESTELRGIR
jgi:hypothetical protein